MNNRGVKQENKTEKSFFIDKTPAIIELGRTRGKRNY